MLRVVAERIEGKSPRWFGTGISRCGVSVSIQQRIFVTGFNEDASVTHKANDFAIDIDAVAAEHGAHSRLEW
jgi:hypothetical protein